MLVWLAALFGSAASMSKGIALTKLEIRSTGWLIIGGLLILQWSLFRQFAQREVIWAYPTAYDQTIYLNQSYEAYEQILAQGFLPGLWTVLRARVANGIMLHLQASILFLFIGPSRLSALTLNFIYFALLQITFAFTLYSLTNRWSVAFLGEGLLLTTITPFFWAGGWMDFRIDFIAFCLFGVFISLVMRSRIFMERRWAIVVGLAAALLVSFRFITMVYMTGVLGLFFLFICGRICLNRKKSDRFRILLQQMYGTIIATGILCIIILPVLWYNREPIRNYYVIGHVTSPETQIRAREAGVLTNMDSLLFYIRSAINDHAGGIFLATSTALLALSFALVFVKSNYNQNNIIFEAFDIKSSYFFVASCMIIPYTALTLDASKSSVVANVLVQPLVWLVLLTVLISADKYGNYLSSAAVKYIFLLFPTIVLILGMYTQISNLTRHSGLNQRRSDVEQIYQLHETVFNYSNLLNLEKPIISMDRITDFFNPAVLKTVAYERHGVLFNTQTALGSSIFVISEPDAISQLQKSDFAVISIPDRSENLVYPFDIAMQMIRPKLVEVCNETFIPLRHFHIFDNEITLYMRPKLTAIGDSDGWVTSKGLILSGSTPVLRARPKIELRGKAFFAYLRKTPQVNAELLLPNKEPKSISATLQLLSDTSEDYRINLNLDPRDLQDDTSLQIHLSFDAYFVPKEVGLSEDMRQLVIRTPEEISLKE